jgi:hypothetical protein
MGAPDRELADADFVGRHAEPARDAHAVRRLLILLRQVVGIRRPHEEFTGRNRDEPHAEGVGDLGRVRSRRDLVSRVRQRL